MIVLAADGWSNVAIAERTGAPEAQTFRYTPSPLWFHMFGNAINNRGEVTGCTWVTPGGLYHYRWAFVYDGVASRFRPIHGLLGTAATSCGHAINDLGLVAGSVTTAEGRSAGVVFNSGLGGLTVIPPLPGDSFVTVHDLNEAGEVTGESFDDGAVADNPLSPTRTGRAFLFHGATSPLTVDATGAGYAITDAGEVAGRSGPLGASAAVRIRGGVVTRLLIPESVAVDSYTVPGRVSTSRRCSMPASRFADSGSSRSI